MASGRIRAKYNLAKDIRQSGGVLKASAEQAQFQNEKVADASFWGRLGGMGAGVGLGVLLAPFTGGASLAVTAGLAGLGSYAGSQAGEEYAGGIDTSVKSGGFGLDQVGAMNTELRAYEKSVEQDRMMSAASDAFSIYTAGGGLSKGSGIGGKAGSSFGKNFQWADSASYLDKVMTTGADLAYGGSSQYLKKQGLDTAYEAYKNRDKNNLDAT